MITNYETVEPETDVKHGRDGMSRPKTDVQKVYSPIHSPSFVIHTTAYARIYFLLLKQWMLSLAKAFTSLLA